MVLIIQEPRAHQPEGQEIVPFEDLVDFGDGEKNVAFLIKKTYEKKALSSELGASWLGEVTARGRRDCAHTQQSKHPRAGLGPARAVKYY